MVAYIRSDLDFILAQIKIAEAHAAGTPLYGPGGLIPTYNLAWGLRTVDGSYNHLLPGQEQWGAAGNQFPTLMDPVYRPADGTPFDPDGPTGPAPSMPTAANYNPSNNPNSLVFDSSLRTISNLLVDQTLGNPAAILTALERAGAADALAALPAVTAIYHTFKPAFDAEYQARVVMQNAKSAADNLGDGDPNTPPTPAEQVALDFWAGTVAAHAITVTDLEAARVVRDTALEPFGIEMQGDNVYLPNVAPDEGLSASFNSWFTLFGQFFDHGLDLVNKGGSGTVFIPLAEDDPLYVPGSHTNFMVLTRATVTAGADGVMNTADDVRPVNTTTAYVDQNQTYASHASHQVFLRQYELNAAGDPVATGRLIEGANGGMANWGEVKTQARTLLGIDLTDNDVGSVPLLRTDAYGNFIPDANGMPQIITGIGLDGIPNTADDIVVSGNLASPVNPTLVAAIRTNSAFLADIAHEAVPIGKIADGDITIGLGNPGNGDTEYDNELLDAHFIAGDGRVNENIGLTAVHHVFHAEHNRLVQHTKDQVLASNDLAFINEWLATDVATIPTTPAAIAALVWDGERLFQAAKFGTEMQYQHLVFEEFARKIQPNINVFLVPDGFDTTIDPSIVAEFAHVVYRFGHSMLTESIDRFDPSFTPNDISLIEGFLNPTAFNGVDGSIADGIAAGEIIRGMTRQVGNEIDEFVTTALRNNLLGLPLDLATINLARGRDTGVPSLNEARAQFYEATDENSLLKPYESWVDFAGHLKHEASIINFIAAYGTHATLAAADTLEEKRDAAMALVGLTTTGSETVALSNASFEENSLADGQPNVVIDAVLGNYTFTPPNGWTMSGTGGLFNPTDGVTNNASIDGTNVVWLGQDGMLSRDTGVVLEEGATYSVSFDIGDRTDTVWPGGVARLVSNTTNTVLQTLNLAAPADGQWSTVTFDTGAIDAAVAGQSLRIEIQQTGGTGNQILVDDIQLNILRPLAPLDEEDRQAFLNGTGQYAGNLGGLNNVDLWIGGLAEEIMPFGGMLGSTFNFVFEVQMESLQNGDRFYYLQRLDGLHLFGEMEGNSFAAMIMRNTNATHLPSDVFSTPGLILEVDRTKQYNPGLGEVDGPSGNGLLDDPNTPINEAADNLGNDPTGGSILTPLVVRDNPSTVGPDANYLRYTGEDHVLLGGTEQADTLIASIGDDTLFGDGGNDRLEGGFGNDIINGGDGDDIIRDAGGDDNIKGGAGNDAIHAGPGLDLVLGGSGQDFVILGTDMGSEIFGGEGDDFMLGNKNAERILGNEGNDWIETGTFDGAPGDNFDEIFAHDGIDGNDVFLGDGGFDEFIGEGGDDIFVGSPGRGKMAGMSGFDWATYKDNAAFVNADLSIPIVFDEAPTLPQNTALDEFESVQGLSGTRFNDVLKGSNEDASTMLPLAQGGSTGYLGSALDAQGIALIDGLQALLGTGVTSFAAGDIILGGDGSDLIQGNAGDDIIDGDRWLDVQIGVFAAGDVNHTGTPISLHKSMTELTSAIFAGTINPGQLSIVRTIRADTTAGDIDTAAFSDVSTNYSFSTTADGKLVVSHAVEDGIDGTDTLTGIERLQFSDGTYGIIMGTPFNDNGGAGANDRPVLNGTAGNEIIVGLAGNDILNGNGGNDVLIGGAGTDTLNGGAGNSTYGFGLADGSDTINETGGIDRITIAAGTAAAPLTGLNAFEGTTGGDDNDLIISFNGQQIRVEQQFGASANNRVEFVNFSNNVYGGLVLAGDYAISLDRAENDDDDGDGNVEIGPVGPDTSSFVVGTTGGDNILGSGENDVLFGHSGNDTIVGDAGDDLLVGGAGNDDMSGGDGNDTYVVDAGGDDVIENANEGIDTVLSSVDHVLDGNVENLVLTGTAGNDGGGNALANVLTGNSGNNVLDGEDGNDILDGGAGNDTADFDGTSGSYAFTLNALGQLVVTDTVGNDGADTLIGIENIAFTDATFGLVVGTATNDPALNGPSGTGGSQLVLGLAGNDTLNGGGGTDVLLGGDGTDTLNGGTGNDLLDGGLGADTMAGGADNDVYRVDDAGDVVNEIAPGSSGTDRVETTLAAYTLGTNVENLTYMGASNFVGTGNTLGNTIIGGALADTLSGLGGNDTYTVTAGDVIIEAAGGGTDTVQSSGTYTLGANVENLTLTGVAAVNGTGNTVANIITGNAAANQLFGAAGNDTLNGGGGADFIDGGIDNDIIDGGDGNDIIIGGAGNDTIDADDGFDTIRYTATGFGNDTINNFDAAGGVNNQTMIDLSAFGLTAANIGAGATSRIQLQDIEDGATDDTLITIRDAGLTTIGTIRIEEVDVTNISATDFIFTTAAPSVGGANAGDNVLNGTAGNDTITGIQGNDTITAQGGDDTIVWNANAPANPTDGRDMVNGGTEGVGGDTFVVNGNTSAETYRIYTKVAAATAGFASAAATEIVITRQLTAAAEVVIAELTEIEEIRINSVDPAGASGSAGTGDTFQVIGDFSGTSLRLNTITIDGDVGDDTVDISALTSAHRIVFRSNGGNDTIIGALQAEDVIELPEGSDISTYNLVENENGTKTISNGTHSVTFTGVVPPQFQTDAPGDGEEENETPPEDDEATPSVGTVKTGTAAADVLMGTAGDDNIIAFAGDDVAMGDAGADAISAGEGGDFVSGGAGRDVIFAGAGDDQVLAGADNDIVYGDAGADRIFGDQGNDMITAGAGDDAVFGGAGDDLFVAEVGDGNDVYFGDEGGGGTGIDTLDMSAATANVTVNLGSGALSHGTASSSQTGNDTIWGIENVSTGSGNDTITASNAANVINGGAGNDTFKFTSTVAANGDTIVTFEPGDRIDLTAIDANIGTAGDQSFTLVSGAPTAAGQLGVTLETRADGDVTVIQGNIDGNAEADFTIEISGHHNLTNANLGL